MKRQTNRRDFLKQSALAGAGFWAAGGVMLNARESANDKVNIACIGIGGKGSSDCDQAAGQANIVAVCDIDDSFLDNKLNSLTKKHPKVKRYNDYRKMLDEMGKEIDAVTVSTPDHTHAPASVMAMRMGKHVYCQKPLTHTVFEARRMREIATEMKVVTQMGNQGTAENGLRRAVEIIQDGVIGPVSEVHVWTNRPIWPQAPGVTTRPAKSDPVPPHVHWDEWLGPAPFRPYVTKVYHDFAWRGWWDFGTGALGDMACHTTNMAFRALKLDAPIAVSAISGAINPETYPAWARIDYFYAARGELPPVTLHWYEGKKDGELVLPPQELLAKLLKKGEKLSASGSILVGEKGTLFSPNDYGAQFRFTPEKDFEGIQTTTPEKLPAGVATDKEVDQQQKKEWVEAIKANKPAMAYSNFDFAGRLTEAMLLGNIAVRFSGEKLEWNAAKLQFANSQKATALVSKEYRKGWDLATIG